MLGFLARRLGTVVPTLVLVSMLIFGLQQLLPGDPAKILAGEEQDPTVIAYLQKKLHLDEPLPVRYAYWIGGVLRGDLGESVRNQQPVLDLVAELCARHRPPALILERDGDYPPAGALRQELDAIAKASGYPAIT